MRLHRGVTLLACVPVVIALSGCNTAPPLEAPAPAAAPAPDPVERGRLLISGGGCHDCHTPKKFGPMGPEPDLDRALSGHPQDVIVNAPFKQDPKNPWTTHTNDHLTAWSGAWGVSFAANLTPDQNTGLGIWTEDMFVNAIKQGKHMGTSRPILPPMPWAEYRHLPDEDLKAMFAYLKSLKPIANRVPVPLDPSGKPIEEPQ
jgi:mono/diheme cytochrome c family protein